MRPSAPAVRPASVASARARAIASLLAVGVLVALAVTVTASLTAPRVGAAPPDGGDPIVDWDHRPDALIIRLSEGFGEVAGDHRRVVEVWGDGRVVVTRPSFMKDRPYAEARIRQDELSSLLRMLADRGVLDFDEAAARAELAERRAAQAEAARTDPGSVVLRHASDPAPTSLEVHVTRYAPEGPAGPVRRDVDVVVDWHGLSNDVFEQPGLEALEGLLNAQTDLHVLFQRPDLR